MDNMEQTLQILSNATGTNTELLNIKVSPGVGDIVVQLDVFNEQNKADKATRQSSTTSLNLNSPLEVFQAIMQQVTKTSHEMTFLIILQHLLRIDPNEPLSGVMWKVVEKLVHRVIQLENSEEADSLLKSSTTHIFSCQNCCADSKSVRSDSGNGKELATLPLTTPLSNTPVPDIPPPPPLPPPPTWEIPSPTPLLCPPGLPAPPPPPPPAPPSPTPLLCPPGLPAPPPPPAPPAPPPPAPAGLPPPPPPMLGEGPPILPTSQVSQANNLLLPQQNTPKSSIKLKTFNWTKIPPHKIVNKLNIWTIMANDRQYKCVELIDFKGIEGLFCLQTTNKILKNTDDVDGTIPVTKKEKEPKHIHLLDAQRSLKINIFLSQFKGYNSEDIVQLIRAGDNKIMNLEKLKDLIKFFQNDEEIMLLKGFTGDRQRLASAEKFLISMLQVPNFKLRIESMILKEEFALNVTYLEPCLNAIIKAGNDLMKNKTLQEVLGIIIIIGNFLNSGGYAGNAAGIKLSSLTKLTDIKANKTGMHLLHLIALEVQRYNTDLLDLSNELSFLENVYKLNTDQIEKDIKDMEFALDIIKKQLYLPTTEEDIKQQMDEFIQKAEEKMGILNKQIEELKSLRITMADFFCEDVETFKVDECFEIFYKFCEQFKKALKENEKRQELELQAKMRQQQKEEQSARMSSNAPITEVKSPSLLSTKRLRSSKNSFEASNASLLNMNTEKNEDDLMTFLQASNRKREKECVRKSRLDKRPDLLKFSFERERDQHSPLLLENVNENLLLNSENNCKTKCLDDQRKSNIIQKSWKRLMEGYKASQLRDKCLTPDIAPRRESLQIFIRSNSTVDGRSGQLKKQPAVVKIIKTPLPKTHSVFNFSENEIQAVTKSKITENLSEINNKKPLAKSPLRLEIFKNPEIPCELSTSPPATESPVEMRQPRVTLKTMASIVQLGCRYSSINEEDLKTTIKKLRTPTSEKTQFCFSPVREVPPRSSLAFSPTTPKSDNCNWEQRPKALNRVDEKQSNEEIHETDKNNQHDLQELLDKCSKSVKAQQIVNNKEQDLMEHQPETSNTNNNAEVSDTYSISLAKHKESNLTNNELNREIILPIDNDKTKLNETTSRPTFSQRLVNKLQNKIRALSPLRPAQASTEQLLTPIWNDDSEKPLTESVDSNKINICSSSATIERFDKNPEQVDDPIAVTSSIEVEAVNSSSSQQTSSKKSFVNRLQNKLRAMSPLKSQIEQEANFHSYINLKDNAISSTGAKPKQFAQQEVHILKQKAPTSRRTSLIHDAAISVRKDDSKIRKASSSKISTQNRLTQQRLSRQDLHSSTSHSKSTSITDQPRITQHRLPRQNVCSSISSTKTNIDSINLPVSSNVLLHNNKTERKILRQSSSKSITNSQSIVQHKSKRLETRKLSLQPNRKAPIKRNTENKQNSFKAEQKSSRSTPTNSSKYLPQVRTGTLSSTLSSYPTVSSKMPERRNSIGKYVANVAATKILTNKNSTGISTLNSALNAEKSPLPAISAKPSKSVDTRINIKKRSTNASIGKAPLCKRYSAATTQRSSTTNLNKKSNSLVRGGNITPHIAASSESVMRRKSIAKSSESNSSSKIDSPAYKNKTSTYAAICQSRYSLTSNATSNSTSRKASVSFLGKDLNKTPTEQ